MATGQAIQVKVSLVFPAGTVIPSLVASPNTRDAAGATARLAIVTALVALANGDVANLSQSNFTSTAAVTPGFADDKHALPR